MFISKQENLRVSYPFIPINDSKVSKERSVVSTKQLFKDE